MTARNSEVLYDGSKYPEYEKARQRGIALGRMVVLMGMLGTPVVISLALAFLWTMPDSELDLMFMTTVFVAVVIADEFLMYFMVRASIERRWMSPPVVSAAEFKFGRQSIPLTGIEKIEVFDGALNIQWKTESPKFPRFVMFRNDEIGDEEEFLKALKSGNAGVQIEDLRKEKSL